MKMQNVDSAGNNFSYLKGHVSFQTFILKIGRSLISILYLLE